MENREKLLENAVAVEMFRRRAECFYHKGRRECDFIIKEGAKPKAAIQVCWKLTPKNEIRELRGLRECKDPSHAGLEVVAVIKRAEERTASVLYLLPVTPVK